MTPNSNLDTPRDILTAAAVDHFGIVVPNLETAVSFYRDVLQCQVSDPLERPGQGLTKAFVQFSNMRIELIEPTSATSPIQDLLETHTANDFLARQPSGGVHHVCYAVPDLVSACAELTARGYRVLGSKGSTAGADGNLVCFLDPMSLDGVLVDLKQSAFRVA
jgi:methylmalonyl-CoA/ethylmalonyl-CoA epimerase